MLDSQFYMPEKNYQIPSDEWKMCQGLTSVKKKKSHE